MENITKVKIEKDFLKDLSSNPNINKKQIDFLKKEFEKSLIEGKTLILYWKTWTWKTSLMKKIYDNISEVDNSFGLNKEWEQGLQYKKNMYKYFIREEEIKEFYQSQMLRLKRPEDTGKKTDFPLELLISTKILFIDDIWNANPNEGYLEKLKFIIDKREDKGLPTIYSTNLTQKELEQSYWSRVVSRIYNFDKVIVLKFWEKDLRKDKEPLVF